MTTRRDFLRSGTAAAAVGLVGAGARAHTAAVQPSRTSTAAPPVKSVAAPAAVVCDRRFEQSVAFAAAAAAHGAAVEVCAGDIAGVLMDRLVPRWRRAPVAVAGLTAAGALFCLEYLARDYGLGLAYRICHSAAPGAGLGPALEGRLSVPDWAERLEAAGPSWPRAAAALALAHDGRAGAVGLIDVAAHARTGPEALFSWLLVPAGRPSLCGSSGPAHST